MCRARNYSLLLPSRILCRAASAHTPWKRDGNNVFMYSSTWDNGLPKILTMSRAWWQDGQDRWMITTRSSLMWNDCFFECMLLEKENVLFFSHIRKDQLIIECCKSKKLFHVRNSKEGNETTFPSDIGNVQRGNKRLPFRSCKPWVLGHVSPFPKRENVRRSLWPSIVVKLRTVSESQLLWRLLLTAYTPEASFLFLKARSAIGLKQKLDSKWIPAIEFSDHSPWICSLLTRYLKPTSDIVQVMTI